MIRGFRSRLAAGERLLGTMVTIPDPAVSEILAGVGFDWLFIDCEHGPLGLTEVLGIVRAVGDKIACIVRVPDASESGIKKVLDVGVTGIFVPQVNTADEATRIVHFAKYGPLGGRGVGLARAHGYGANFAGYLESAVMPYIQQGYTFIVAGIDSVLLRSAEARIVKDLTPNARAS